jgi:hypothetical protein
VLNSGRGAVNNGMSVVCEGVDSSIGEGNLGSGASQKESKDLIKKNKRSIIKPKILIYKNEV